jgi:uncharacterized protein YecT (DUF1311 family)
MAEQLKEEDKNLNQTYQTLRTLLSPQEKEQLKNVQLIWIAFRDKSCDFQLRDADGSMYAMFMAQCLARYTATRNAELILQVDRLQ